MRIRREDKEAVKCMAFVGAVLGACLGPILILNQSRQAHEKLKEHQKFLDINASVLSIDESPVTLDQLGLSTSAVGGVLDQLQETESEIQKLEGSFWLNLPLWALAGMSLASFVGGIAIGYHFVWALAWTGSYIFYSLLRLLYKPYWQLSKDEPEQQVQEGEATGEEGLHRRNANRIMPLVIKLILLAVIALTVLAFVLCYLTAIKVPSS